MKKSLKGRESSRIDDQRLNFYIDNSPLAVIEWNSDFVVTLWTGGAEDIFGWESREVTGKKIMDLNIIYEQDIPLVEETMKNLIVEKKNFLISKNRNYRKDRSIIYCIWYNTILHDDNGQMVYTLSQVADVSRQMEYEMQLFQMNKKKDQFLKEMSNGLKSAVNAHKNYTGAITKLSHEKEFSGITEQVNSSVQSLQDTFEILKFLEGKLNISSDDQIITVPHYNGFDVIKVNEIIMCEADGYCTKIHLNNEKMITSSKNLKYYEEMLSGNSFQRVHRSFIINLKHVHSYTNQGEIILTGKKSAYLGDNFKKQFIRNFIIK